MKKAYFLIPTVLLVLLGATCGSTTPKQKTFFCGDNICSVDERESGICPRDCDDGLVEEDLEVYDVSSVRGSWNMMLEGDNADEFSMILYDDGRVTARYNGIEEEWGNFTFDGVNMRIESLDGDTVYDGVFGSSQLMKGTWNKNSDGTGGSWTAVKQED